MCVWGKRGGGVRCVCVRVGVREWVAFGVYVCWGNIVGGVSVRSV